MAGEHHYTAAQVATAGRELREAAGADDDTFQGKLTQEHYDVAEVIELLSGEISLLHERGFSNARIADLLSGFDIDVTAEDLAR
jgi:hypothetical protein